MNNEHKSLGHPLTTGSLNNFIRLLQKHNGFELKYSLRVLSILLSNVALLPLRSIEIKKWNTKIRDETITKPPIFILGHFRSGTTHLHNVITRDEQFGYVSTMQTFCPDLCIEFQKIMKPVFKKLLPKKRPMDNMLMSYDLPQEDEFAIANSCPHSFYDGYYFPRSLKSNFDRIFIQNNEDWIGEWEDVYMHLLKKMTLIYDGKPLVIKNPLNIARIQVLLDLFPNAKFIHIYRNPYTVYYSVKHTYKRMIRAYQLQSITDHEIDELAFYFYKQMMQLFWKSKELIPDKNFTELKFEEFEEDPVACMKKIYTDLDISGYNRAQDKFTQYIKGLANYQKNHYARDPETDKLISEYWGFSIKRLNYSFQ